MWKDLFLLILFRQPMTFTSFQILEFHSSWRRRTSVTWSYLNTVLCPLERRSLTLSLYRSKSSTTVCKSAQIFLSLSTEFNAASYEGKSNELRLQSQRSKSMKLASDTKTTTSLSEDLGKFDPSKKIPVKREVYVGDPQQKILKDQYSVTSILTELAAIQQQGPQKYCILGTRHCSFLHQQIIELLSYALVLSENHVYTSGAMGTNAAAIRGALRAGRPDLLTVILPQSLSKQPNESQDLLKGVTDLVTMPENDEMNLDVASRRCNSKILSATDQLIAFAFHESTTVIEATSEAKKLDMLVTTLFLD